MDHALLIILIACIVGFAMSWGVGANDLGNIMSTTIASKAVSFRQAIFIAIVFEIAGALLGGTHVTATIRSGIINTDLLAHQPMILVHGMLAVLLAGATWMLLASYVGMPVSITNAIVGAIVGFGLIELGIHDIHWPMVLKIAISWICSPTIACLISYLLFNSIRRLIFDAKSPSYSIRFWLPVYFFLVGLVLGDMTVVKGLLHFNYELTPLRHLSILVLSALVVTLIGMLISFRIPNQKSRKRFRQYHDVEKLFSVLMAFTACAMVFAHGSNDVAIAVGPITTIVSLLQNHGVVRGGIPEWILWLGCVGVLTGLFMYGRKVIATVGSEITLLTPSRAFAATLAAASTVIVSTSTGIPVSATQTLVGGVLGVGLARGIGALNIRLVRNIFLSWMITIPAAAGLCILYYYLFQWT